VGTISGLAQGLIQYNNNDVSSVTLTGSDFADTFVVRSTPLAGIPVTINGAGGDDMFIVGSAVDTLNTILGPLTLNGGSGTDEVVFNDQGSTALHTYDLLLQASPPRLVRHGINEPTVTVFFTTETFQLNPGPVFGA
jgi:hypothetical protein